MVEKVCVCVARSGEMNYRNVKDEKTLWEHRGKSSFHNDCFSSSLVIATSSY